MQIREYRKDNGNPPRNIEVFWCDVETGAYQVPNKEGNDRLVLILCQMLNDCQKKIQQIETLLKAGY